MRSETITAVAPDGLERVDLAGGPIFYRQRGAGAPLILLHGWGGSSRYWVGTLERLGRGRAVYAPDLPGYGESPPCAEIATPQRLAEAVIAFADALGIERFDLNGHSFSAGVACYLADRHPQRVRRLVLTCFSTYRSERERRLVDQVHHVMALWMALRRPWMARSRPIYRAVARRFFHRPPDDDAILRQSFLDFLKMDKRTALESAATAGSPEINPAMRRVRARTLLIGARQDGIMPPAGTPEVARLIPDCRLAWIEHCGHLPMIERPEAYHQLVERFLSAE